ncbi:MAG: carboxylating nicotinate-nucleotide diphosphorylase [Planctomycetota bacterium]
MPPTDLNTLTLPDLYRELSERVAGGGLVRRLLELARDEDLGPGGEPGDLTGTLTLGDAGELATTVAAREPAVVAGLAVVPELLELFAPRCTWTEHIPDGNSVETGTTLGALRGPGEEVVRVERPLLNLVGRLCGIATRARAFVDRVGERSADRGGRCMVLDTRKTTPGLRVLEKYAVRCGGAFCHRLGLYDAVLIKDNHLAGLDPEGVARRVTETATAARERFSDTLRFVEVEVDTLAQLDAVLSVAPGLVDHVLLDNMPPKTMREAATRRDVAGSAIRLEASGGITLETVRAAAESGVERVSVGSLTHGATSVDVGLDAR